MNKPIGAIDGDLLYNDLENDPYMQIYTDVMDALKSTKYALTYDQGEATRLRDDITEAINIWEWMQMDDDPAETMERVIRKLREALSPSHREDGIQKVRELYEKYVGSDDRKNRGIALGVKLASEALGISIAVGGQSNE